MVVFTITDDGFLANEREYHLENYAIRPAIMFHLLQKCKKILYSPTLVHYYDGESRVNGITGVISIDCDSKKEKLLIGLMLRVLKQGHVTKIEYQEAESLNLHEFKKIISIWEGQ